MDTQKWYAFVVLMAYICLSACQVQASATVEVLPTMAMPAVTSVPTIQPDNTERTLTVYGQERTYRLHIPAGLNSVDPVPLVFVFHGHDTSADTIIFVSGFNDVADVHGFIVVYPLALGSWWDAGGCCTSSPVDEAKFVQRIISDLGMIVNIDSKRIYASGFSSGAMLSYRLACEMSETFAAIAPVAGELMFEQCQPKQSVSVVHFHGVNDATLPFVGGSTFEFGGSVEVPAVEESINTWVKLNRCSDSPQSEGSEIVTHIRYTACQDGMAVELYAIEGIGHSWPSKYLMEPSTSEVIWDFFAAHPKR